MKIKFIINDKKCIATLYNNDAAKTLIAQLPIVTKLEDYAKTEVIFYPEKKLSEANMPEGYSASMGDITYYAPWGNIAIFYKDFGYAAGLVSLGKMDREDLEALKSAINETIRIELIK